MVVIGILLLIGVTLLIAFRCYDEKTLNFREFKGEPKVNIPSIVLLYLIAILMIVIG